MSAFILSLSVLTYTLINVIFLAAEYPLVNTLRYIHCFQQVPVVDDIMTKIFAITII